MQVQVASNKDKDQTTEGFDVSVVLLMHLYVHELCVYHNNPRVNCQGNHTFTPSLCAAVSTHSGSRRN